MKIQLTFILISILINIVQAQDVQFVKIFEEINSGQLKSAKSKIDEIIKGVEYKNSVDAWFCNAVVYHTIYESEDINIKNLSQEALSEAFYSYKKTNEFDKTKKYQSEMTKRLNVLANQYSNKGVREYNEYKYEKALESFENSLEINNMPMFLLTDSNSLYNAAMCATLAKKYDKAVKYYEKLIEIKYGGSDIYLNLSDLYKTQNNIDNALNILKSGIEKFPNNSTTLVNQLINLYLDSNKKAEAKELLENIVSKGTNESSYYVVLASLYNPENEFDKVSELYKKAIELNNADYNSNYQMGALWYNKAIKQNEYVNTLTDEMQFKAEKAKVDEYFKNTLPYFENADKIKPNSKNVLSKLKFLYKRFDNTEKYNSVCKQLGES
ncbi:MAG: hypothetical protein A2046_01530 [Bacteroidetes bacterium GWA2_30_7]|nr:MAG: hypothetical protein A2046_01530 [Bacteroidetes bacterium GWA2_30_7]